MKNKQDGKSNTVQETDTRNPEYAESQSNPRALG
jgi:hypothetical protein